MKEQYGSNKNMNYVEANKNQKPVLKPSHPSTPQARRLYKRKPLKTHETPNYNTTILFHCT